MWADVWEYKFGLFWFFKVHIYSVHLSVQWSENEVIFRRSNPSQGQREERGKRLWHVVVSRTPALMMSRTPRPWTLQDPALTPVWQGFDPTLILLCLVSHLSRTSWPFHTNSCLLVKAWSISPNSLNLHQASVEILKHTGQSEKDPVPQA